MDILRMTSHAGRRTARPFTLRATKAGQTRGGDVSGGMKRLAPISDDRLHCTCDCGGSRSSAVGSIPGKAMQTASHEDGAVVLPQLVQPLSRISLIDDAPPGVSNGDKIVPPATSASRSSNDSSHRWIGLCTLRAYWRAVGQARSNARCP